MSAGAVPKINTTWVQVAADHDGNFRVRRIVGAKPPDRLVHWELYCGLGGLETFWELEDAEDAQRAAGRLLEGKTTIVEHRSFVRPWSAHYHLALGGGAKP